MPLLLAAPIETERLHVRPVAQSDLAALMAVNGDPEVTRFLPYATWNSMDDAQAWFVRMDAIVSDGTALQMVLADKANGLAIGTCLLFRYDAAQSNAELGFVLGRSSWGAGLMREALSALLERAFATMGVSRLDAVVDPRNQASVQLLKRLGFVRDGSKGELEHYALTRLAD